MSVDWRLGLAPDVGGNAFSAFMQGQQAQEADKSKNALTAYATNPNAETLGALAPYKPEFVLQQKQAEQEKAAKLAEQKVVGDALSHPDPTVRTQARQQLAYTNSDLYMKLDENGKKAVDTTMKAIGQQAFHIMQLPKEQQEPALQQALQGLQAQGIDTSSFHLTGNPDVDLRTALAVSGQLDDFEKFNAPVIRDIQPGGGLYSMDRTGGNLKTLVEPNYTGQPTGTPAGSGQVAKPADKAAYDALRPGQQYEAPDGSIRIKGGASGNVGGPFRPVGVNQSGVTSTYRTPKHNAEVGGVKNSYHTRRGVNGEPLAVDSVPPSGMSMADYAAKLRRMNPNYDVINEGDHVHIEPKG